MQNHYVHVCARSGFPTKNEHRPDAHKIPHVRVCHTCLEDLAFSGVGLRGCKRPPDARSGSQLTLTRRALARVRHSLGGNARLEAVHGIP